MHDIFNGNYACFHWHWRFLSETELVINETENGKTLCMRNSNTLAIIHTRHGM